MSFRFFIKMGFVLFLMLLSGCGEPSADLNSTKTYNKNGLTFNYPGNWSISEEITGKATSVFLETPGDTIVIIQKFPAEVAVNLKGFSKEFSESMASNLPVGHISSQKYLSQTEVEIDEQFSISLLGEVVPHRRKFLYKKFDESVCYIVYQVPDEDYEKSNKGLDLIDSSLSVK